MYLTTCLARARCVLAGACTCHAKTDKGNDKSGWGPIAAYESRPKRERYVECSVDVKKTSPQCVAVIPALKGAGWLQDASGKGCVRLRCLPGTFAAT